MLTFDDVWAIVESVKSWVQKNEARLLYDLATECDRIVELGVGRGRSVAVMAATAPELVYGVSLWDWAHEGTREECMQTIRRLPPPIARRITLRFGDSSAVGYQLQGIPAPPFDMIFIDGDHSYDGVTADIKAWAPLLIADGYLVFHDYPSERWIGVQRAVDELLAGSWAAVAQTGRVIALQQRQGAQCDHS